MFLKHSLRTAFAYCCVLFCLAWNKAIAQAPCTANNGAYWAIFSTNLTAIDFGYEAINDSMYLVRIKGLYRCKGDYLDSVIQPHALPIAAFDTCNNTMYQAGNVVSSVSFAISGSLPDGRPNYSKILGNYCTSFPCQCDSPYNANNLVGFKERWYETIITLPENCGLWTMRLTNNVRDTLPTNISHCVTYIWPTASWNGYSPFDGCPNLGMHIELNHADTSRNSSPVASNIAPVYVCENQAFSYNPGYIDADGDSLVHTLQNTRFNHLHDYTGSSGYITQAVFAYVGNNILGTIPYSFPYTLAEPFSTNNTFSFNSADGSMNFTPTPNQQPLITTRIDEYRNGVWMGSSTRDFTFVTVPCTSQPSQVQIDVNSIQNASLGSNTEIIACIDQPMQACFYLTNPDNTSELKASSNITNALQGSTVSFTQLSNDSIKACITWTASNADIGDNFFAFLVSDTSCKAPGVAIPYSFGFNIKIHPKPSLTSTFTICEGDTISLSALNSNNYNCLWSNASNTNNFYCDGSFNCGAINIYPSNSEIYYMNTFTIGGACTYADTSKVFVVNKFIVNATDTIVCGLHPVVALAANALGQNVPVSYTWSPSIGIIGGINLDIINVSSANTNYIVSVTDSANCFIITDTSTIVYDPTFSATALANKNNICIGDTVLLTAAGGTISWSPNYNITNLSGSSTTVWPDTSTVYMATIASVNSACVANINLPITTTALRADAGRDTTIRDGDIIQLGGVDMLCGEDCLHFWYDDINFLNSNNIHTDLYTLVRPPSDVTFRLRLVSKNGDCVDEDFVKITVLCDNADIANSFMPDNVFTNDINRTFGVRNAGLKNFTLSVYNRYGQKVFYTNDCLQKWDGTFRNKPCAMDTYVYVITGTCANGTVVNRNGNVILIR
jgi:gliding motility-associated-like protein